MTRLSFYDRMKQFHLVLPNDTPILIKHIASVMFTFANDDGGGIFASVETIMEHSGENERSVQRAIAWMKKEGWLVDDGWQQHEGGQPTKRRRLVLEDIGKQNSQRGDNTCDLFGQGVSELTPQGVTKRVPRGDSSDSCYNIDEPRDNRENKPRGKTARGSRLPDDWQPSPEDVQYARSKGVDPIKSAERFKNYWGAATGKNAVKLNWSLTWKNWCISAAERGQDLAPPSSGPFQPPKGSTF